MRFTAVQEQPEIPKHEAFCEIHRRKCIALDATDTVAQPGQVQVENQLCHTANWRTAEKCQPNSEPHATTGSQFTAFHAQMEMELHTRPVHSLVWALGPGELHKRPVLRT